MPAQGIGNALVGVAMGMQRSREGAASLAERKELLKLEQDKLKLAEREMEMTGGSKLRELLLKEHQLTKPFSASSVYKPETGEFAQAPPPAPSLQQRFQSVGPGGHLFDLSKMGGEGGQPVAKVPPNPRQPPSDPVQIRLTERLMQELGLPFDQAFEVATGQDENSFLNKLGVAIGTASAADPTLPIDPAKLRKLGTDLYRGVVKGNRSQDKFFDALPSLPDEIDAALKALDAGEF